MTNFKRTTLVLTTVGLALLIGGSAGTVLAKAPSRGQKVMFKVMSTTPQPITSTRCEGVSTGTVVLTLDDPFKQIGDTGSIKRNISYLPTKQPLPDVGEIVPNTDYRTSLDMQFPPKRVDGHGSEKQFSTLRIVLVEKAASGATLSFFTSPPLALPNNAPVGAPDSWLAVQSGNKHPKIFCGLKPIVPAGPNNPNPYIELGVQGVDRLRSHDSLNIGVLVTKNGLSTPIIIDPKVGNDG